MKKSHMKKKFKDFLHRKESILNSFIFQSSGLGKYSEISDL